LGLTPATPAVLAPPDPALDDFQASQTQFESTLNLEDERRAKARKSTRTDTSDEEGLDHIDYCRVCGSDARYLPDKRCKSEKRIELLEQLIQGWLVSAVCGTEADKDTDLALLEASLLDDVEEKLRVRQKRVASRLDAKRQNHAAKSVRRGDFGAKDIDNMLMREAMLAYRPLSKVAVAPALGMGLKQNLLAAEIARANQHGRHFKSGSSSEAFKWTSWNNALSKIANCWRSHNVAVVQHAKRFALGFLAEVSSDYIEVGLDFAIVMCRRVLNEFEDRMVKMVPDFSTGNRPWLKSGLPIAKPR
jgi:hypothetical protein